MIRKLFATILGIGLAVIIAAGSAHAEPRTRLQQGTQVVGTDVLPGLYSTPGPRPSDYGACFIEWLPYKGARSSELIDIQAYEGRSFVQLHAGDVITVSGCDWVHEP